MKSDALGILDDKKIEYNDIIVEKKYPVGYITINRPEKRNDLTFGVDGAQAQIAQACEEMKDDPKIKTFVLKGGGPCFSAGFDLTQGNITGSSDKDVLRKGREKEVWPRFFRGRIARPMSRRRAGGQSRRLSRPRPRWFGTRLYARCSQSVPGESQAQQGKCFQNPSLPPGNCQLTLTHQC